MSIAKYYDEGKFPADCAFPGCGQKIAREEGRYFGKGYSCCCLHTPKDVEAFLVSAPQKAGKAQTVDLQPIVDALGKIEFQLQEMRTIMRSQGAK